MNCKIDSENFAELLIKTINEIKDSTLSKEGPYYQNFRNFIKGTTKTSILKRIRFLKVLLKSVLDFNKKSILDVGSGYGVNLIILKYLGFEKVTGIEIVEALQNNSELLISHVNKYFVWIFQTAR